MKKVAFLIFVLWGLSSHVHASSFSGEGRSSILEESAYQVVIKQFCKKTENNMLKLTLPTTE